MADPKPLAPGLYVAATPIGNLGEASPRLVATLQSADYVLCEDTRVSGKLLSALSVSNTLKPYHDHNGARVRPGIITDLEAGGAIALISDAGTPLISDPGYKLVADARAAGVGVFAVSGPSAVTAALSVAGVPTDRFTFLGFLPAKAGARATLLEEMRGRQETLILYESGPKLGRTLGGVAEVMGDRPVVVLRELTKLYEEAIRGTAAELSGRFTEAAPKGEIVVVIPPVAEQAASEETLDAMMQEALSRLSLKDAAAEVAKKTGTKRRDLYQAYLGRDD